MFYLIGTGINNYKDMPIKGLEICKNCDYVFIERYTSILGDDSLKELEERIGKEIVELKREDLESNFEELVLNKAISKKVALLIVGDPLTATTHIEFLKNCKEKKVNYKVIHASSIFSSVCETGLHIYRFGKSCSIPYPEVNYKPTSFFNIIENNWSNNSHTIVFLDIKSDKNKYMTINEGLNILLEISNNKNSFFNKDVKVIGISRLGGNDQKIKYGKVSELLDYDFGLNPHILIIPKMTSIEEEYVTYLYS